MNNKTALQTSLDRFWSAARRAESVILDGTPMPIDLSSSRTVGIDSRLYVHLDEDDMVALIMGIKPKIVYIQKLYFDVNSDILTEIETDIEDDDLLKDHRVIALKSKWAYADGKLCSIRVSVIEAGVVHLLSMNEVWLIEFNHDVAKIEEVLPDAPDESLEESLRLRRRKRQMAEKLAAHPLFLAPKATKSKRKFLAIELFPDERDNVIDSVVEEAESVAWSKSHR